MQRTNLLAITTFLGAGLTALVVPAGASARASAKASAWTAIGQQDQSQSDTRDERPPRNGPPTTRPGEPRPGGEARPGGRPGERPGDRNGERPGERRGEREPHPTPTAEQWSETLEFLREHAPFRALMMEQFQARVEKDDDPERSERGRRMLDRFQGYLHDRVSGLEQLGEDDPELHELLLKQFELEDMIASRMMDHRKAREVGEADQAARAQNAINESVADYIATTFAERELRISRLETELAGEKDRLQKDRERREEMADRMKRRFERTLPPPRKDGDDNRDPGRDGDRRGDRRDDQGEG